MQLKNVIIILTLFVSVSAFGQDCTDYHQFHCTYGDYTFFYSRQSKSALFKKGQTSELRIVSYAGEDYYVSVCAHRKFGDIHYRIIEDNANKTVIYDNAQDDFSPSVTFSSQTTRNLIIEVTVPEGDGKSMNDRRCVGVVIQFRKSE